MTATEPRVHAQVRSSTDADVEVIHAWLQQQDREDVAGSFLCNWSLTMKQHRAGRLLVFIDESTGQPVAYQWGGLLQPGILEVRNDMRGRGIGKALVAHRLAQAAEAGEDILFIQCEPAESIPFWQSMGFQLLESDDGEAYAFRYMPRKLELPAGGDPVEVSLEWFPEDRKWAPNTPAAYSQRLTGVRLDDEVFLPERALCLDRINGRSVVLRVLVEGEEWFLDKARNDSAAELGVQTCANGFYVDVLCRPHR